MKYSQIRLLRFIVGYGFAITSVLSSFLIPPVLGQAGKDKLELSASVPLKEQKGTLAPANSMPQIAPKVVPPAAPKAVPHTENQTTEQYLFAITPNGWDTAFTYITNSVSQQNMRPIANIPSQIDLGLLQEYGCQLEAVRILNRGQRKIVITAYRCATADGAYGAYCAERHGSSSYVVLGDASSEDQNNVSFCKDQYFITLQSMEQDDDEAKSVMSQLATMLVDHIEFLKRAKQNKAINSKEGNGQTLSANPRPQIFNWMPVMQRVRGSEKLIMGPIGMRRFFPAPYNTSLLPLMEAAVSIYRLEEPHRDRLKLLIACYPSAQAANLVYANYTGTLRSQNKEKTVEGFSFSTTQFKVSDYFVFCQLRDRVIVVITGAHHKDTSSELAHQIYF